MNAKVGAYTKKDGKKDEGEGDWTWLDDNRGGTISR